MFAGPNGSGKSTIASFLPAGLLGKSVNADDIEAQVRRDGYFDAASMGLAVPADTLFTELVHAPVLTADRAYGGAPPSRHAPVSIPSRLSGRDARGPGARKPQVVKMGGKPPAP